MSILYDDESVIVCGPSAHIECSVCKTIDGDCGFGSSREWGDE